MKNSPSNRSPKKTRVNRSDYDSRLQQVSAIFADQPASEDVVPLLARKIQKLSDMAIQRYLKNSDA